MSNGGRSMRRVLSRKGHRRKAEKGFNLFCARLLFVCAVPRFEKPRKVPKGFNFVSGKICCSALNRGSENLDVLCKENELSLFASCKK